MDGWMDGFNFEIKMFDNILYIDDKREIPE
jgi:hypothetical protein